MNPQFPLLLLIITAQFVLRILYSVRLYPEADYCMNSQYDVVLQNGGRPGRDFELSWGAKLLSYFACRWARRLLPFGIVSPRIAFSILQGLATLFVYLTTAACTDQPSSALAAAFVYAVTSTLIHTGTYVCSPENFDAALLPVLALLVLSFDLPSAVAAGALGALLTAYSKMVNALYFFPVLLSYASAGHPHLAFAFALCFFLFLLLSMVQYRLSPYYQPFARIFGNAYRYATRTQDRSQRKRVHYSTASFHSLWKGLLREIPIVPFALLLSPAFVGSSTGGQVVLSLGWTAVLIMLIQNKLWPVHLYPGLSMAAVLTGLLFGQALLQPILMLLLGVSLYYLIKPLSIPRGRHSRYFWREGSGALHYLDDEASLEASRWIRTHAPDTKRVFCWGMQTQLYTHLELMGPTPIQHFSRETLTIPERQAQLTEWLRREPPEFIFFSDPYFCYYPLSIIEGVIGWEYELARIFGEGHLPLYRLTFDKAPDWKKRIAARIGFDFTPHDESSRENPPKPEQIDHLMARITERKMDSLFIYGSIPDQSIRARLESQNVRILGIVQTSPRPEEGALHPDEVPWPLKAGTGVLITARSYSSVVQIRESIRKSQTSVSVLSVLDDTVIVEELRKAAGGHPLLVYGLGTAGRSILSVSKRANLDDVFYHDRKNRIGSHPFLPLEELKQWQGMVFLGAAPSTNISLYYSLLAEGVEDSRMMDFGSLFHRSCLPGSGRERLHLECYQKHDQMSQ